MRVEVPHPECGVSPTGFQQVVEGSASRVGAELELDFASSPGREAPEVEGQWSEEQRYEACRGYLGPGDPRAGVGPEAWRWLSHCSPGSRWGILAHSWCPAHWPGCWAPPAHPMPSRV